MTVRLVTTIQRWIGESGDTKPTEAPVGSTFYELDTGQGFIWNSSEWVEDLTLIYAMTQALAE